MKAKFIRHGLLILLVVVLAAGSAWFRINRLLSPVAEIKQEKIVKIPKGSSPAEIGRMLAEAGVIRSGRAFRGLAAWKGLDRRLRAGEFSLSTDMSVSRILDRLVNGPMIMRKLTVPEGLTMARIADLSAAAGLSSREGFLELCRNREFIKILGFDLDSLEGYLFPETYHFAGDATTVDIIRAMVERFKVVWSGLEQPAGQSDFSRHQLVTLASIVEKETAAPDERPLIAAVFFNRLKIGMPLQSDPTVIYGLPGFNGNLTRAHLEMITPYNTYQIRGLPPGPIANPGAASLRAVLDPADEPYLYFVSRQDGTHQFSRTLAEHNRAVVQYQLNRARP